MLRCACGNHTLRNESSVRRIDMTGEWHTAPGCTAEGRLIAHRVLDDTGDPLRLENGAQRSERKPAYYHMERGVQELFCERMLHGEKKHGRANYQSGGPEFVLESYDHFMDHLLRAKDEPENAREHISALLANAHILAWHWLNKPENFKLLWNQKD